MPFSPAIPLTGLAGFRFLEQTQDRQRAVFDRSPDLQREIDYFLDVAPEITSAEELVRDRRALAVVLGAFGLDEDINKGAFIRKVLEEGTLDRRAFANRLVEPAYREMSAFLGFGDTGGLLVFENTRLNLVDRYRDRQFELAVGEVDLDMRLALNFKREAAGIAASSPSGTTGWLRMLGSPPLRQVLESALVLPSEFALIDLDQQVAEIADRAERIFGIEDPTDLQDGKIVNAMVDRFLVRQQALNGAVSPTTRGSVALSLLSAGSLGTGAQANLFASNFL